MGSKKLSRTGLILVLLSAPALGQRPQPANLPILLYDAAGVGPKTVQSAERLAAAILLTAGIEPAWNTGSVDELRNLGTDFSAYPPQDCRGEPVSAVLSVQLLAQAPPRVEPQLLALSLPFARRGVQVTIYVDRIVRVVRENAGPTFSCVLAYAIAHEVGHVLLHSEAHEPTGLMKGSWSKSDWQRAALSVISFSREDRRRIAEWRQRMSDENATQLASR